MASIDDLMAQIPISSIAQRLGVDEDTARNAVQAAVPTLLGGMQANATDANGEAALASALTDHHDRPEVDDTEGEQIVNNVFGDNTDQVYSALGAAKETGSGVTSGLMARLMPMLAPMVLAYVAKQFGNRGSSGGPAPTTQAASGGGLGDLLGGLLGGNRGGSASTGGLGGMLGGLLGGNTGGGLGNILGGLLGDGKR